MEEAKMEKDNSSKQMGEVTEIEIGKKNVQIPSKKPFKKHPARIGVEKQLPSSPKGIGEQALKEGETSSKLTTGLIGTEIGVKNENLNPVMTQVEKAPACKPPKENTVAVEVYPKRTLIFLLALVSVSFIILIIIGIIGLIFIL